MMTGWGSAQRMHVSSFRLEGRRTDSWEMGFASVTYILLGATSSYPHIIDIHMLPTDYRHAPPIVTKQSPCDDVVPKLSQSCFWSFEVDVFCRHPTCSSALGSCNLGSLSFSSSLPSCPSPPPPAWPWPSLICCLSLCLHPRIHQNHPPTPPHLHLIRTKMDKMISFSALSMMTEIPPMFLSQIKLALLLFVKVFGIYLHPAWLNCLWKLRGGLTFYHVFLDLFYLKASIPPSISQKQPLPQPASISQFLQTQGQPVGWIYQLGVIKSNFPFAKLPFVFCLRCSDEKAVNSTGALSSPSHSSCLESLYGDFLYIAVLIIGAIRRNRD